MPIGINMSSVLDRARPAPKVDIEGRLRDQIDALGPERRQLGGLADRFELASQNINPRLQQLRGGASTLAAQEMRQRGAGTSAASTLQAALRRAKTRQGIVQRGEASVRGQRLKDRLGLVRSGLARRGKAIEMQERGLGIARDVKLNAENASARASSARNSMWGGALGVGASVLKGNYDNNQSIWDFGEKG